MFDNVLDVGESPPFSHGEKLLCLLDTEREFEIVSNAELRAPVCFMGECSKEVFFIDEADFGGSVVKIDR